MICSMMKKGLLGAALGTGALYLAFGTSAPSYVRTAFHKARHHAHDSVPIQFEIDRARHLITELEPAILNNREELARAEVDVEHLGREIASVRANLDGEKRTMVSLRDRLSHGDLKLAGQVSFTPDEVKAELGQRFDHYKNVGRILEDKEKTLKSRQTAVIAARLKLTEMAGKKRELATKVEAIQARLQAIEATQEQNEFNFDDTALAQAKKSVSDLERRLEVKAKVAEMEGRFPEAGMPVSDESGRDVLREFDDEFGPKGPTAGGKSGDKSL